MSYSLNRATIMGHVGKDPEIKYTEAGEPIANFSVATSSQWTNKAGEKQESTQWHRITVFGKLALVVRDYVAKGMKVFVEGEINYDEWIDKAGQKKYMTKIKLSGYGGRLIMLDNGKKARAESSPKPNTYGFGTDFGASADDVPF